MRHGCRFSLVVCFLLTLFSLSSPILSAQDRGFTFHDALMQARENHSDDATTTDAFQRLAKEFGTPLYIYDRHLIEAQASAVKEAFGACFPRLKIFYAMKANTGLGVVSLLRRQGLGMEVISGGEILTARKLRVPGSDIIFTSSSKSPWEVDLALREGALLNLDSLDDLEHVERAADRLGKTARVSFRVNPGVDPHTIHQINTGITESKFGLHLKDGIALNAYRRAKKMPHVKIEGLHCHIGSQITDPEGYLLTIEKLLIFAAELKENLGITLGFIDIGGGIGIAYHDGETVMNPADLAAALKPIWQQGIARLGYEPTLWIEPGRFFVAPAGFLLTRVNTVKTTPVKTFVNVDCGFNTLMRPAMYQAYHRVRVIGRRDNVIKCDIAGDVCETGDILAADRDLPKPRAGDLVVILDAGAYGFSMASEYNARPLPAEVLIEGNRTILLRKRGQIEDLFRHQIIPR